MQILFSASGSLSPLAAGARYVAHYIYILSVWIFYLFPFSLTNPEGKDSTGIPPCYKIFTNNRSKS